MSLQSGGSSCTSACITRPRSSTRSAAPSILRRNECADGYALDESGGSQVASARIAGLGKEIGVVAMRGRIRYLVAIGCSHAPEVGIAAREKIHRLRLEAIPVRGCSTRAGQGGASDTFMRAMLAATLDRPECRRRPRRRHRRSHHNQGCHQAQPRSSHLKPPVGNRSEQVAESSSGIPTPTPTKPTSHRTDGGGVATTVSVPKTTESWDGEVRLGQRQRHLSTGRGWMSTSATVPMSCGPRRHGMLSVPNAQSRPAQIRCPGKRARLLQPRSGRTLVVCGAAGINSTSRRQSILQRRRRRTGGPPFRS